MTFFSLRISVILVFFGYYLWQFFKNEKSIDVLRRFLSLNSKKKQKQNKTKQNKKQEKKNALSLRPVTAKIRYGALLLRLLWPWGSRQTSPFSPQN